MTIDDDDYPRRPKRNDVGRGRPPMEHRFKRGTSGNPRGRPRGSGQKVNPLDKILNRKIRITEGGKSRSVTIEEAMTMQQVKKAVEGDPKAFAILFRAQAAMEKARREGGPTVEEVLKQREEEAERQKRSAELSKWIMKKLQEEAENKKMGGIRPCSSALQACMNHFDPDKEPGEKRGRTRPEDAQIREILRAYLDKYYPHRNRPDKPTESSIPE